MVGITTHICPSHAVNWTASMLEAEGVDVVEKRKIPNRENLVSP
jgi:hypothetical protein